jgi:hypothetical protein
VHVREMRCDLCELTNAASTANAGSGCQCVLRLVRTMPLPYAITQL